MGVRRVRTAFRGKAGIARAEIGRYAFAFLAIALAVAIKSLPRLGIGRETPFLLLLCAIMLAAFYGGRGPAALAVWLAAIAADYFFLPPYGRLSVEASSVPKLVVFVIEACVTAAITVALREAQARARRTHADAEAQRIEARLALEDARVAAEQVSRAKDEFLRIASHELRTPLTPIMGWAQILQRDQVHDPERLAHGLDVILTSARAEARLVEDLIDVTRIVAGTMSMEMQPVEVGPIVVAAVEEIRPSAAAKGVDLGASIAEGLTLMGDEQRLRQVARKLLSNALKFTPRGGRIHVTLADHDGAARLSVRDTGKGIDARDLSRMFAPFHPGDRSTTRAEGGLGLGLTIVRYIVEAHGGSVHAESPGLGAGTTFTADLGAIR